MARAPKQKYVTKKHLARLEREQLQTRYILIGTIAVVVLALGLIGYGLLNEYVLKPAQPIVTVGKDKVSITDFQELGRYSRLQIIQNYVQLAQLFGNSEGAQSYLQQIQSQLEPSTLGQSTLNTLIEDRLIRQEAARRGITVTKDEIDQTLEGFFGYYPNGSPTPKPTLPEVATSTLSPLQMTLVPPTATASPTAALTLTQAVTQTVQATQVLTQTATPAPTFTSTPSGPTPTFTPEPTATAYTLDAYKTNYADTIKNFADIKVSEAFVRRLAESFLYRQKVEEIILAGLEPVQDEVWARHILVEDEALAKEVLDRLNKGEDFATLARELSTDASSGAKGGDLGWFPKGQMVAEFEQAAFSMAVGEISQPVKSTFGYHIIQVLGHENRPLASSDFDTLRQKKMQEWLDAQREEVGVKINDNWLSLVPTEPALPTTTP